MSPTNFSLADAYYAATSESDALDVLSQLRVRYVLAKDTGSGQRRHYGPEHLLAQLRVTRGSSGVLTVGGATLDVPALERHRLVYESAPKRPTRGSSLSSRKPQYQLYEIVEGALLTGQTSPGAAVVLRLDLRTKLGAPLFYTTRAHADSGGSFTFRVPYPTESFSSDVSASSEYILSTRGLSTGVQVTRGDVREGREVVVRGLRDDPVKTDH